MGYPKKRYKRKKKEKATLNIKGDLIIYDLDLTEFGI
jgi:hypothetical protein